MAVLVAMSQCIAEATVHFSETSSVVYLQRDFR